MIHPSLKNGLMPNDFAVQTSGNKHWMGRTELGRDDYYKRDNFYN